MILRCASAIALAAITATAQGNDRLIEVQNPFPTVPLDDSEHAFGTGMCAGDFDADGTIDLIVLGDRVSGYPNRLFVNDGNMQFSEHAWNLGPAMGGKACRAADIDNDGDLDVVVANWWNPAQLFINDGTGRFTEEAQVRGVLSFRSGYSATFADYDRDGWIDLYIGNRFETDQFTAAPNYLFRNLGNGYFQNVTLSAGLDYHGASLTCEFVDYNEDLWPDLFVTNEKATIPNTDSNELFHNNGDGTFTRVGASLGLDDRIAPMGFDFVDAFNDGGMDFYMSDLPFDHLFRVWDESSHSYVDATHTYNVHGGFIGWACSFVDIDNDGWQDIQVVHANDPTYIFRNPGRPASDGARWPRETRWTHNPGRKTTSILADFDDDGRVDLLHRVHTGATTAHSRGIVLHRNVAPAERNWIKIRTVGTHSNRDGIGTRVEITAGGRTQRQWVRVGSGFLSGQDRRLHFGLGDADTVDLVAHWPSGQCQRLDDVPANQILELVEPELELLGTPGPGAACLLELRSPCDEDAYFAIVLGFHEHPRSILPDGRPFSLALDQLSAVTLTPGNSLLHGNVARLHRGWGQALLTLPASPAIRGMRIYAGALTFEFDGIMAVLPALPIDL